jgi:NitT/TauT family transport system permease protein
MADVDAATSPDTRRAAAAPTGEPGLGVPAPAPPPDPKGTGKAGIARKFVSVWLPPLVMGAILALAYWYFSNRLPEHRKFLMPSYGEIWRDGLVDSEVSGELWEGFLLTARIAFQGLAISILIGCLLGILMFRFRWLERANYPFLVALQSVPILAITPLLIVAFGYQLWPKTMVCVIISFFPIPTTLLLGLRSVDQDHVDLFRLQKASWLTTLRKLALPHASPSLFAGLRISAGLSVVGAIVGELFFQAGSDGLGQLIISYRTEFQYPAMYAALVWSSALSISVYVFFSWLGNRLFSSWHESGEIRR